MHQSASQKVPDVSNFRLVVVDNITLAFESSKISKVDVKPEIKRQALMPSFMVGEETNLCLPVIDILSLYNLKWTQNMTPDVLVKIELCNPIGEQQSLPMGFLVNEYLETIEIPTNKIKLFCPENPSDLSGVVKIGKQTICILNIEKIFSTVQFKELSEFLHCLRHFN